MASINKPPKRPSGEKTLFALQLEKGLRKGEQTYVAAMIEIKLDKQVEVPEAIAPKLSGVENPCSSSLSDDSTKVERVVKTIDGVAGCKLGPALQSAVWSTDVVSEEARWNSSDVCGLPGTE